MLITSAAAPAPGGQGFAPGQDPENVDANGVENIVQRCMENLPVSETPTQVFVEPSGFASWEPRDDVVMGGSSSSSVAPQEDSSGLLSAPVIRLHILRYRNHLF